MAGTGDPLAYPADDPLVSGLRRSTWIQIGTIAVLPATLSGRGPSSGPKYAIRRLDSTQIIRSNIVSDAVIDGAIPHRSGVCRRAVFIPSPAAGMSDFA